MDSESNTIKVKNMTKEKFTIEEMLAKAKKPGEDALKLHPYYEGKIQVVPKCSIWDFSAFAEII